MKSVKSNTVEGFGRRIYKQEYVRFIIFALSSNDEAIDHPETLFVTKSLVDHSKHQYLLNKLNTLGIIINNFS